MSELFQETLSTTIIPTKVASDISGYNTDYLARLCREGKIEGTQVGRTWLINRSSLELFMRSQEEKKRERAEELRIARGKEYRRAQKPIMRAVIARAEEVRGSLRNPIPSPRRFSQTAPTTYSRPLLASAVALAVVAGGAYASTNANAIAMFAAIPNAAIQLALDTRPYIESESSFRVTELTTEESFASTESVLAAAAQTTPDAHTVANTFSSLLGTSDGDHFAFVREHTDEAQVPFPETEIAKIAEERVMQVARVAHDPFGTAVNGYVMGGMHLRNLGTHLGAQYLSAIQDTANVSLATAATTRDAVAHAPRITSAVLDGYTTGVYAWTDATPKVAGTVVMALYDTGNLTNEVAAVTLPSARVVKDDFAQRAVYTASVASDAARSVETLAIKPFKPESLAAVHASSANILLGSFGTIAGASSGAYDRIVRVQGQVFAVPLAAEDSLLGAAGYAASVLDGSSLSIEGDAEIASALPANVVSFFPVSWQRSIEHLFNGAGSLVHAVITHSARTIARLMPGGTVITPALLVVDSGTTEYLPLPIPVGTITEPVGGTGPGTSLVQNIVNNYFPQTTFGGSFDSAVLAVVRPYIQDSIDSLVRGGNTRSSNTTTTTTAGGVSSDGATLTNVTINSGNAILSLLTATTADFDTLTADTAALGTTTVAGDLTVSGAFTADSLSVSDLSSNNVIVAPYFTATSTTATSTFPNVSATNAEITNATSTNLYATAAHFVNGIIDTFNATTATIATLTGTNSTYVNATTTNATTTNLSAANASTTLLTTSNLGLGGQTFTSLLGTGLSNVSGALSVSTSTFSGSGSGFNADLLDGLDSVFFLANGYSTTSADYWLTTKSTTNLAEGSNQYFTEARARDSISETITGIEYASSTGILSLTSGYSIPLTASTTDWNTAFLNRITSAVAPLSISSNAISISQATGSTNGYLSSTDWNTFNNKQAALTFTYPLVNSANTVGLAFGTSTSNTWDGTQTFINAPVLGSLSGFLKATAGALSTSLIDLSTDVTSTLASTNGGTGFDTYTPGDLLYADSGGTLAKLPIGSSGQVLKVQAGLPAWGVDQTTSGGGGGDGIFATSTNLIYPMDTSNVVVIGTNATATPNSIFEVNGQQYISTRLGIATTSPGSALSVTGNGLFSGNVTTGGSVFTSTLGTVGSSALSFITNNITRATVTAAGNFGIGTTSPYAKLSVAGQTVSEYFTATSTTASTFPYASTTALTVGGGANALTIGALNGLLKATSGAVSTAVSGTDYAPATSGTSILYGNGAGGFSNAVVSAPFSFSAGTLSITQATGSTDGYLSSTDWNTFNNKVSSSSLTSVLGAAYAFPLTGNATSTLTQFNGGLTAYASSTIGNGTATGGLTISGTATTTGNAVINGSLTLGSLTGILKATNGLITAATAGTDYENPLTFTYPLQRSTNTISLAFGTTTSNAWAGTQTFANAPVLGSLSGVVYGNNGVLATQATSTATLGLGLSGSLTTLGASSLTIATSSLFTGTAGQIPYFNGTNSLIGTSSVFIASNQNIGIGSTTPWKKLSVSGDFSLTGALFDASASAGSNGYVLQSTGTGTQWVATSTLGYPTVSGVAGRVAYFNSANSVTSAAGFTFDGTNLAVPGSITTGSQFIGVGGAGDASVPTYSFSGDLTTGMYHAGTNLIGFSTGGVGRVVIDGNGYLGIGTTTPATSLSVAGSALISSNLTVSGTATIGTLSGIVKATGGVLSAAVSGTDYAPATSGTSILYGNGAGGFSNATVTYPIQFAGGALSLAFGTTTANSWSALQQFNANASTTQLTVTGNTYLATTGGNVGIGTTSPAAPLHVFTAAISGRESLAKFSTGVAANDALYISNSTTAVSTFSPAITGYQATSNTQGSLVFNGLTSAANDASVGSLGVVTFLVGRTTSATDPINGTLSSILNRNAFHFGEYSGDDFMVITAGGNVGIGTTSPYAKLSVAGQTVAEYFTATSTTATSTVPNLLATNLRLSGSLYDSTNSAGTNGYVLQTTGSGTQWVATSSLGFTSVSAGGSANQVAYFTGTNTLGGTAGFTFSGSNLAVPGAITAGSQFIGLGGSGDASTPAYSFASDLTTGMYHVGTNIIGFSTGGVGRVFIDGNGYLGIGTSTPSTTLSVEGNTLLNGTLTLGSLTGVLKATNGVVSAAVSGTDYAPATSGTSLLYGNGSGGFSNASVSSPLSFSAGTLSIADAAADGSTKGAATFTAADFNAASGVISIDYTNGQAASASTKGFLTSTDWSAFNNKISSTSLSATYPLTYNSSTGAFNLAFGTTTSNTWAGTQTFTNAPVLGSLTGVIYGNSGALAAQATSTATLGLGLSGSLTTLGASTLTVATSSLYTGTAGQFAVFNGTNSFAGTSNIFMSGSTIGIGTTSPATELSVAGSALISSNLTVSGTATIGNLSGIVKATAGVLSAAVSGTDYAPATSGTSILYGNGSGGFSNAAVSSPLSFSGGTLSIADAAADGSTKGAATFTAADFNAASGVISIDYTNGQAASASTKGFLTSTDWSLFNNKVSSTSLSATYPLSYNSSTGVFNIAFSTTTSNTWSSTQTFSVAPIFTGLSGLLQGNGSSAITAVAGTAGQFPYYNGTNTLAATSSIFLATSGNIGIGTSSPTSKLSLAGGSFTQSIASDPTLVAQITDTQLSGVAEVRVAGNYAYTVGSSTFSVIDISKPTDPVIVASLTDTTNINTNDTAGLSVNGRYAYIGSKSRFTIIDISNPNSPYVVSSVTSSLFSSTDPLSLYVSGKYAYVASGRGAHMFITIDISNPSAPFIADTEDFAALGASMSVNKAFVDGIAVQGRYAYIAIGTDADLLLQIYDVSNPLSISLINQTTLPVAATDLVTDIVVDGRYVYVGGDFNTLWIVDVSDPTAPVVSTHDLTGDGLDCARSLAKSGNYLYAVSYFGTPGVCVYDVSDPTVEPVRVGRTASPVGSTAVVDGLTSLVLSGRYLYTVNTDQSSGTDSFFIFDVTGSILPTANIGSLAAGYAHVTGNFDVYNTATIHGGLNVGMGGIYTNGAFAAAATTSPSYFGSSLGVGTTTPYSKLSVWGAGTGTGQAFEVVNNASSTLARILDNGTAYFRGNVGIGTTSPYAKLSVVGQTVSEYFTATSTTASTFPYASTTALTVSGGANALTIGSLSGMLYANSGAVNTATISAPLSFSAGTLSISQATASTNGYLSSTDWSTFNGKLGSTTISALTTNYLPKWNGSAFANSLIYDDGTNVGVGTTTSLWPLTSYSASSPQLALSAGAGIAQWTFRNAGGNLYLATTTAAGTATTSPAGLTILGSNGNIGIGTTSPMAKLTLAGGSLYQSVTTQPVFKGKTAITSTSNNIGVHVVGRYAYVVDAGSGFKFAVVDISNPTAPTVMGEISDVVNLNAAFTVKVSGQYAYVTSSGKLVVIDISNPTAPTIVGTASDSMLSGARGLYVSGRYAYVGGNTNNAFVVVDISNPTAPVVVGSIVSTTTMERPDSVFVSGKYAYVTGTLDNMLTIVDISNPTAPTVTGTYSSVTDLGNPKEVWVSGRYAYVLGQNTDDLAIIDVSNPASPTFVSKVTSSTALDEAKNLFVAGRYAYVTSNASGSNRFTVVDISNPSAPFVVTTIQDATNLSNPRGVYISGRYAYIATATGLSVMELDGIDIAAANLAVANAESLSVFDSVNIGGDLNIHNGLIVGTGGILSGGSLSVQGAPGTKPFTVASSTGTELLTVSSAGYLGVGSSTPGSLLSLGGIANFTTATSTFYSTGGINLTGGCFAVNGTCIGSGSSYTFSYPLVNTANTISLAFGTTTANSWSGLQEFNGNASTTQLTVTGNTYLATTGGSVGVGTTSPWGQLSINPNGIIGPAFVIGSSTATKFIVTNAGNVGVGTTTPSQALSVTGTGYFTGGILFGDGSVQTTAAGSSQWTTSGNNILNANTGNVGIGTTTPYAKLSIAGFSSGPGIAVDANTGFTGSLIDLKVASTTAFSVSQAGAITVRNAGSSIVAFNWFGSDRSGSLNLNGGLLQLAGGTTGASYQSTKDTASGGLQRFGAFSGNSVTTYFSVFDDAVSNVMALRNGTNANTFRVYNTSASSNANYERGTFDWQASSSVLRIGTENSGTGSARNLAFVTASTSRMTITAAGDVGIGTTTPTAQFHTTGTVRFSAFGSGTLTTDASGNVTASSDERLKTTNGSFTRGLADIQGLSPILYHWNAQSGLDRTSLYAGFSAQNVQAAIPEAVDTDPRGFLTLQDRPILAASVNAIKELAGRTDTLSLATTSLSSRFDALASEFARTQASSTLPQALTATEVTAESMNIAEGVSAGTLTTQTANIDGTVSAARYIVPATAQSFNLGSTTIVVTIPEEALTSQGDTLDLYTFASYAVASVQDLAVRTELLTVRIDDIETRLAALEAMNGGTGTLEDAEGAVGFTLATLQSALGKLGLAIKDGVATLASLVTHQLVLVDGEDGTSSTGSETIPQGETELRVTNPLVHTSSKIFITFMSSVEGGWYISEKKEGSFTVKLSQSQNNDTAFDYFLLQTDPNAQVAAVTEVLPEPPDGSVEAPEAPEPVSEDGGPTMSLQGSSAVQTPQGGAWTDPGATATAADGTDLTASIVVSGTVDVETVGIYTLTYRATDAGGKSGQVSRIVQVLAPTTAPTEPPAVVTEPPAEPESEPVVEDTSEPEPIVEAPAPAPVTSTPDPSPAS